VKRKVLLMVLLGIAMPAALALGRPAHRVYAQDSLYYIRPPCNYGDGCVATGYSGPGGVYVVFHGISQFGPIDGPPGGTFCPFAQGCIITASETVSPPILWISIEMFSDSYGAFVVSSCIPGSAPSFGGGSGRVPAPIVKAAPR
jgi:hypothetical protein